MVRKEDTAGRGGPGLLALVAAALAAALSLFACIPDKPKADLKSVGGAVDSLIKAAQEGDAKTMRECLEAMDEPKIKMKDKDLIEFVVTSLRNMGIDDLSVRFQAEEASYTSSMGGPTYKNIRLTSGKVTYWVFNMYFDGVRPDLWTPGTDAKPMGEAAEKYKYMRVPDD